MFVGRNDELQILSKTLQFKSSSVMIYGKRKVGKTTLIKKALESSNDTTIYYECLKVPIQDNIDNLVPKHVTDSYTVELTVEDIAGENDIDIIKKIQIKLTYSVGTEGNGKQYTCSMERMKINDG